MSCFVKQIKQNIWNKKKYNNKKKSSLICTGLISGIWCYDLQWQLKNVMKNVTSCYNRVKCKWFMKVLQCILIIYYNKRFNFELCMYVILFWSYILSLSISSLCMFQVWFWKKWFQNTFLLLTSNFWILERSIQWKTPKEKTLKLWMNKNITKENNGVFFFKNIQM